MAYAEDPEKTSKKVSSKKAATLTPCVLAYDKQYSAGVWAVCSGQRRADTAYGHNKLILETDNPDPRVRIRALELLGKISDVGLFAEKSEVTITHQSTEDLKNRLRSKLAKLVNPEVDAAIHYRR